MSIDLTFPLNHIALLTVNRPDKLNAINRIMCKSLKSHFQSLNQNPEIRCIIITGSSKSFCAGMDLQDFWCYRCEDPARGALFAQDDIKPLQDCITTIETCQKPVIAAVSGYCLGAGVDIITACCIRLCSKSAILSIKEIYLGITADLGVLQRLPKIVGSVSWIKDIVYTGRNVKAEEGLRHGLYSAVFENFEKTLEAALEIAKGIVEKSPVAMVRCKKGINYARDHTVEDGLEFSALVSAVALQTPDVEKTIKGVLEGKEVRYPKL